LDSSYRETWMIGAPGSTYAFRMRGVDQAGNQEVYPEKAEINIKLPLNCSADEFETPEPSNNTWNGATRLDFSNPQLHNFCGQQDIDWMNFSADKGVTYRIMLEPQSDGTSVEMKLFGADHEIVLAQATSDGLTHPAQLEWTAPDEGAHYLRITGGNPDLFGTDTYYKIQIDRIAQLQPTAYFWSAILLPILWTISKLYHRIKSKLDPDQALLHISD